MPDVDRAVKTALPTVLELIETLGSYRKPVHFHLHDGHPLSRFSPFGVSDHLSFFAEIPIGFDHNGRRAGQLMFGPAGLRKIAEVAVVSIGRERVSFTLEIHPTFERLTLGDDALALFRNWADKTNAEKMNHWLEQLVRSDKMLKAFMLDENVRK
jgi:hypothetical protein